MARVCTRDCQNAAFRAQGNGRAAAMREQSVNPEYASTDARLEREREHVGREGGEKKWGVSGWASEAERRSAREKMGTRRAARSWMAKGLAGTRCKRAVSAFVRLHRTATGRSQNCRCSLGASTERKT
eukprot:2950301-Pleurochrysis_carterae.AAC.6